MTIYRSLGVLFLSLIAGGGLLTWVVFKFDYSQLRRRNLDIKIVMWLPFGALFLLTLYFGLKIFLLTIIIIIGFSIFEFGKVLQKSNLKFIKQFRTVYLLGLLHLPLILIFPEKRMLIATVVFATVLSDVGGFFFGNVFKWHPLPERYNKNKSWEGVIGQFIGASLGLLLIKHFAFPLVPLWLFIPIGFGSALGDLANSRAKRVAEIKNWSEAIPGHGGFVDRFCSIAGSSTLVFYFLLVISLWYNYVP